MNQTGARYLKNQKARNRVREEEVCISHYKPEQVSIPVKDGVRKRPKALRRKAE
ncbi:MAG: hypothetical protein GY861_04240 [bacterium]|nr:hypothetical protein [bacterium]